MYHYYWCVTYTASKNSIPPRCYLIVGSLLTIITQVVSMTLWRLLILNGQLPTFSDQDNPLALSHHLLTRWHERGFSCSTVYYIHMSTQKPRLFLFWQIAFLLQNNAHRVLSLLYLPAVNMGLLLAPVSLSYDWQTGSIPAIVTWSDGRNAVSFLFYVSLVAVAIVGFIRTNVRFNFDNFIFFK